MDKQEVLDIVRDLLSGRVDKTNLIVEGFVQGLIMISGEKGQEMVEIEEDEEWIRRVHYYKEVENEKDLLFIPASSWFNFVPEIKGFIDRELTPLHVSSGVCVRYSLFEESIPILQEWAGVVGICVVKDFKCYKLLVTNKLNMFPSKNNTQTQQEQPLLKVLL